MKKVVTVGIGGKSFVMDEDAYQKLNIYLSKFKEKTEMGIHSADVMEDLEERIADLFTEALGTRHQVVNITTVNSIIAQLGMPDGSQMEEPFDSERDYNSYTTVRKLYRNPDDKTIGGVCSGLALYLNVDVILVRVLFIIALFLGSAGFWAYIIIWIIAPIANTAAKKCEMRGIPVTAENLRRFSSYR